MNFTPGPWKTSGGDIQGKNNRQVAITNVYMDTKKYQETTDENFANARLIAAAPDLYDALMAVYKDLDIANVPGGSDELAFVVARALEKAS